jgi:repressor LexA
MLYTKRENTNCIILPKQGEKGMEYSIFERLLHEKGATVYQVSKATKIAASTFTDWKNGRSTPKVDKLARIAEYFSLTLDELMGTSSGTRDTESAYRHLRARKMVPVIGVIRAGRPIVTDETMLGHEFADVDDVDEYFYLEVCGDSMKNCGIVDGTYVLFHKQQYAENGDIVVAKFSTGQVVIKEFNRKDNVISLTSRNPQGQNFVWDMKEKPGFIQWVYPVEEITLHPRKQRRRQG